MARHAGRHSRTGCVFGLLLAVLVGGCAQVEKITLSQANAPRAQQRLALASRWTFYADDAGQQRFLLAFPLPGALNGPRDFLIYVSAPPGRGDFRVDLADPAGVRGFLIQEVGQLAGRTDVVAGRIRVEDVLLQPNARRVELQLTCADGATMTGKVVARNVASELAMFERRFAADIAQIWNPTSQPAETDPGTARRNSGQR